MVGDSNERPYSTVLMDYLVVLSAPTHNICATFSRGAADQSYFYLLGLGRVSMVISVF